MNKVNLFPALTTPFQLIFLSNLCNTDKVASVTEGIVKSNNAFLSKLPNILPRHQPGWIILDK